MTSRAFCLRVGFGSGSGRVGFDQKARVSGSGSGIVHIVVLRLIFCHFV